MKPLSLHAHECCSPLVSKFGGRALRHCIGPARRITGLRLAWPNGATARALNPICPPTAIRCSSATVATFGLSAYRLLRNRLAVSIETVVRLVKTKIPGIDWPTTVDREVPAELWSVPIRARGQAAIDIAKAESSADEPLWLSAMRATGVRDGERCLTIEEAERIHATDPDAVFLTIGRVGWCVVGSAFNRERIVEGPFRTYAEALASMLPWDAIRSKSGYAATNVDFYVALRHTPETFWHMVRRLDAERQSVKASR